MHIIIHINTLTLHLSCSQSLSLSLSLSDTLTPTLLNVPLFVCSCTFSYFLLHTKYVLSSSHTTQTLQKMRELGEKGTKQNSESYVGYFYICLNIMLCYLLKSRVVELCLVFSSLAFVLIILRSLLFIVFKCVQKIE